MSDREEQLNALRKAALAKGDLGTAIVAANLSKWEKEAEEEKQAATEDD